MNHDHTYYSLNPGPMPLDVRREKAPKGYRCSMCAGPLGACVVISSPGNRTRFGTPMKPHELWAGFCLKCVDALADAAEEA